jgi:hypothetical protein
MSPRAPRSPNPRSTRPAGGAGVPPTGPDERAAWREATDALCQRLLEQAKEDERVWTGIARYVEPFPDWKPEPEGARDIAMYCLFDYRTRRGARTFAERALRDEASLPEREREVLRGMVAERPSLYRVRDVEPGRGGRLEDVFRHGEARFVEEPELAERLEEGTVVPARVYRAGSWWFAQPLGAPLPPEFSELARERLEAAFRAHATAHGGLDREAFLRDRPESASQACFAVLEEAMAAERGEAGAGDGDDDDDADEYAEGESDGEEGPTLPSLRASRRRTLDGPERVYELEVRLRDVKPEVHRRIRISAWRTLGALHEAIQLAMGWTNSHLHVFTAKRGRQYSDPTFQVEGTADEWSVPIGQVLPGRGSRVLYEYDFGDGWEHEVLVEDVLAKDAAGPEPRCVSGGRACPPEDVGGAGGYEHFLEALSRPDHEEHDDLLAWYGGPFDPERFDRAAANKALARMK